MSTSTSIFESDTDLDIASVTVNGIAATRNASPQNLFESYFLFGVPITFGQLNEITVTGVSRGNGSYGGNATFIPTVIPPESGVPEPSTWAMMVIGFATLGFAMRRKQRQTVRFGFA